MKAKLTERLIKSIRLEKTPYEIVDSESSGFILRVQPSGVLTYYLIYRTTDGVKKRYRLGRHGSITLTQARDLAKNFYAKALAGQDIQAEKQKAKLEQTKSKARTLHGFVESFYDPWVRVERKTGIQTLDRLKLNFSEFMALPLEEISPKMVGEWCIKRRQAGKAASTINRDMAVLKAILAKAVEWDLLEHSPLVKVKRLKVDSQAKIRYLSADEEQRLLLALNNRDKAGIEKRGSANAWRMARDYELLPDLSEHYFFDYLTPMVLVSMHTGLRRGELFTLGWAQVNFERATLTVMGSNAKSGKTRHLPLNTTALSALKNWWAQCGDYPLVFANKEGQPMDNVRKSWAGILTDAGIQDFRWHDLRHHFASRLVMSGVDLNTTRELLGHSDLSTTLRYAHLAPEHKAEAVSRLVSFQ